MKQPRNGPRGGGQGAKGGPRPERIAEALRAELADLIRREVKDPRIAAAGMLTVSGVRVSGDLGHAEVGIAFSGGEPKAVAPALIALGKVAGFLRGAASRKLGLKHAPELKFHHDQSGEALAHIEALLRQDPPKE